MQRYLKNGRNREIKKDKHKREAGEASIDDCMMYCTVRRHCCGSQRTGRLEALVHEEATKRGEKEEIKKQMETDKSFFRKISLVTSPVTLGGGGVPWMALIFPPLPPLPPDDGAGDKTLYLCI
jgi:hypothetical protein